MGPCWDQLGSSLGPSWGHSWGRLGASPGHLGATLLPWAILAYLGALLGYHRPSRSQFSRPAGGSCSHHAEGMNLKHNDLYNLVYSWLAWAILGPSWGHLGAILGPWGHLGAILGHCGASWAHLGAIFWPSWALLVPSWLHLGAMAQGSPQKGPKRA